MFELSLASTVSQFSEVGAVFELSLDISGSINIPIKELDNLLGILKL